MAQLSRDRSFLMVIDLQERLLPAIHDHQAVRDRSVFLIRAARILGLPIVWTEQYRKGLGPTVPPVAEAIGDAARPMEKMAFGCLCDDAVARAVESAGRDQLILCGIEAHVCVLQTALAARERGLTVFLAEDAIGSRRPSDRDAALRRMAQAGCVPATSEMLVMEALRVAGTDPFKQLLPLLKG
ncbi:MAG TPA: hydrolase [Candidatus Sumerlaeota bacterium]|nr:hydrolase [Candidatus Sumerlaeota bacterium]HPK01926.1 hydrolase [Candidatus Sumerlaeota bacterium]